MDTLGAPSEDTESHGRRESIQLDAPGARGHVAFLYSPALYIVPGLGWRSSRQAVIRLNLISTARVDVPGSLGTWVGKKPAGRGGQAAGRVALRLGTSRAAKWQRWHSRPGLSDPEACVLGSSILRPAISSTAPSHPLALVSLCTLALCGDAGGLMASGKWRDGRCHGQNVVPAAWLWTCSLSSSGLS